METLFQCARREVGLVCSASPDVIASVDRLHFRHDLRANGRAYTIAAHENVGVLDATIREMYAHAATVVLYQFELTA